METVGQAPADAELHLLTEWGDADAAARRKKAVVGTVLVHAVVIGVLISVPPMVTEPEKPPPVTHVTILELPTELTQKAPNKGPLTKELQALSIPRRAVEAPAPVVPKPKAEVPKPAVTPAPPQPPPPKPAAAAPPLPEPPKLDPGIKEPPKTDLPAVAQNSALPPPPPQIQPVEKPKIGLDPVGPAPTGSGGQARIPDPRSSVADTIRDIARAPGAGMVIGDPGASESGYGGITQRPTPGTPLMNVELKFDPKGVDFRPYITQLIQTVRRNWMTVIPQSVKLGRRGKVSVQFRINKDGTVTKAVFAQNSGAKALDDAAISGISMSNPFPPLPGEFKGDNIVLQLNFVYR